MMGRPPGRKNNAKRSANGSTTASAPRKAPAKQAAAGVPAPAPERKPNDVTPEQNAAWMAEYQQLETEKQRIAGEISALSARVKSAAGVKRWKSIKWTHAHRHNKDEAAEFLEDLVQIAAQQDIRISWMGNQATFADIMEQNPAPPKNTKGSRDLAAARAHSDGFNSGRNGAMPSDNPFAHEPGSEQYVAWHDGRDEGQQARERAKPTEARRVRDALAADATLPGEQPTTKSDPIF